MHTAVSLLRELIRFDTSNPPGRERACLLHVRRRLAAAGIPSRLLARDPGRPNLFARIRGRGRARPLLLYGHVDVVPAAPAGWTRPPFSAALAGGMIWGRGALDMKSGVAMYLDAFLRAAADPPPGDLLLLLLADEEAGGQAGAAWIARTHPGLLTGVRHALGEVGGWTMPVAGRRLYPIMVAEKQSCHLRATVRGAGGHGSLPGAGGAPVRLARLLEALRRTRLPVHVTPAARRMVCAIADALGGARGLLLRRLLRPAFTNVLLDRLGPGGRVLDAGLHHTVNVTVIRGGEAANVVPSKITVTLDCRVLPGFSAHDVRREVAAVAGPDVRLEIVRWIPGSRRLDLSQFDLLAGILRDRDPGCHPVPFLIPACTDGRHLAPLGIQTYGFTPLRLPAGFDRYSLIHGINERVPADAVAWGAEAVRDAVRRYGARS